MRPRSTASQAVRWKYNLKKQNKTASCSLSPGILSVFVLVKQVQKGWGGLGVLWVVHKWEEQGHRRRTEQQHWTGRLPVRVALRALSWLSGSRPTACRSAVHRPTTLQHRPPVLNHRRILSASTSVRALLSHPQTEDTLSAAPDVQEWNGLLQEEPRPQPGWRRDEQDERLVAECRSRHAPVNHSGAPPAGSAFTPEEDFPHKKNKDCNVCLHTEYSFWHSQLCRSGLGRWRFFFLISARRYLGG